jgi:hypothetical protein
MEPCFLLALPKLLFAGELGASLTVVGRWLCCKNMEGCTMLYGSCQAQEQKEQMTPELKRVLCH